jgi:hypothetical protein
MDDTMRVLTEQRRSFPMASPDELAPARGRLFAEMATEVAPNRLRGRSSRTPARRRFAGTRRLWALGAVAAVAITAVVITVPEVIGGSVPPAQAEAVEILNAAAEAALAAPFVEPRPDQFLYTKIVYADGQQEIWSSIDGVHDGRNTQTYKGKTSQGDITPGCRNGKRDAYKGDQLIGKEDCVPEPVFRPDLPTNTDAMYAYLLAEAGTTDPTTQANWLGKYILYLSADYLRPATRAALFRAAARLPGVTVIRDATDAEGRHGLGIAWTFYGHASLFVFDPQTFTLLDRHSALVDQVGQRP